MKNESLVFYRMIRDFLTVYLPKQKAASPHTIKSYKNTLNIFLDYSKDKLNISSAELGFQHTRRKHVESFLDWLEYGRKYSIASRNQRLAGLKTFYKYSAGRDATLTTYYQELLSIPTKKESKRHEIDFFSESALQSILEQPDISKKNGSRDIMFMILLYDTGARVQEMLDVILSDIHLSDDSSYVMITGKGRKTRIIPIMKKTMEHLRNYMHKFHSSSKNSDYLFYVLRKGNMNAMSPDNVEKFILKYGCQARIVNKNVPNHLYPHMFRHARSMHLYRNGMPLPLLSEWLGHAQMETTITYYANADSTMKQKAIEKATSALNPLFSEEFDIKWEDDDELIKKLYGLI